MNGTVLCHRHLMWAITNQRPAIQLGLLDPHWFNDPHLDTT